MSKQVNIRLEEILLEQICDYKDAGLSQSELIRAFLLHSLGEIELKTKYWRMEIELVEHMQKDNWINLQSVKSLNAILKSLEDSLCKLIDALPHSIKIEGIKKFDSLSQRHKSLVYKLNLLIRKKSFDFIEVPNA